MNKTTIHRLIAFVLVVSVYLILKFQYNFFDSYTKEDVQKDKTNRIEHDLPINETKDRDSVFNGHGTGFQDTSAEL